MMDEWEKKNSSKQNELTVLLERQTNIYLGIKHPLSSDDSNAITHTHSLTLPLSIKFAYARFYLFIDSSFLLVL